MKKIGLVLLTTAMLSIALTGCGDDSTEIIKERVMDGKHAEDVVDHANELNQDQSDQLQNYLDE